MNSTIAVVVTYNRCNMLQKCLDALLKQSVECDILVVDNNSSDNTSGYVASLAGERIIYHNTGINIGGAGGFNTGIKLGMMRQYQYFWLMDDDCIPEVDALEKILDADRILRGDYGFLVSRAVWLDGSICRMNRPKFLHSRSKDMPSAASGLRQVKQATFVSFFLPRQSIEKAGLPQKEFFIWGDDTEYSRRLAVRKKMASFLVEESIAVHAMQHNHGSDISRDTPERLPRYELAYRNESCLYRREGTAGLLYYTCRCIYHLLKVLCLAPDRKLQRIKVIISAYWRGFFFNPPIEYFSPRTKDVMDSRR